MNLSSGLWVSGVGAIVGKCREFSRAVPARNLSQEPEREVDLKLAVSLASLAVTEGDRLLIEFEGEDEEAERLARSLYSAFSSRYIFALNFGT